MFVSIYYKPSVFNAHTMISIVHIFMNVNKLGLNPSFGANSMVPQCRGKTLEDKQTATASCLHLAVTLCSVCGGHDWHHP